MRLTEMAGFAGAILAGAAYLPQIAHLVREHCSAGISRLAFCIWLLSSILVASHAVAIESGVFVFLGAVQIAATVVIIVYSTIYADSYCEAHRALARAERRRGERRRQAQGTSTSRSCF